MELHRFFRYAIEKMCKEKKSLNHFIQKIRDFDDLNTLFFQVLARNVHQRTASILKDFEFVPYLNSSLFEVTELESNTIKINSLSQRSELPLFTNSVLINRKEKQQFNSLPTLNYLFAFLDAYNFASEGSEEVQEEAKTLINASVLGLIFEKINGHKDGSVFTPGFITMYMCREAVANSVLTKFNNFYNWNCTSVTDLYNKIDDILQANQLINSITICDPAVGSGHFLVSALNELIRLKYELGILVDSEGKRIKKSDYTLSIENDELIVTDAENNLFEYNPLNEESRRIQETLFKEKKIIIENCLFGVDINPNSVKICRLRLWIELLKNAYYTAESDYKQLETLPNIDINIKCGNSLLHRFDLTDSIKSVLKETGISIGQYRNAVNKYKNAQDKAEKWELDSIIAEIKSKLTTEIGAKDPKKLRLNKRRAELVNLLAPQLFEMSKKEQKDWQKRVDAVKKEIAELESYFEEINSNKIYLGAFEWRIEFPEVLDADGNFIGFDCVIGNPPYIQLQSMGTDADVLERMKYKTYVRTGDIYCLFYEQGMNLLKPNGCLCYITSNKWMRAGYGKELRQYFIAKTNPVLLIDFAGIKIFDAATVETNILIAKKESYTQNTLACIISNTDDLNKLSVLVQQQAVEYNFAENDSWIILSAIEQSIKRKIEAVGTPLKDWDIRINYGIKTGFNEAFVITTDKRNEILANCQTEDERTRTAELIRPILRGRDIKRYAYNWAGLYLIATFPSRHYDIEMYPAVKQYLLTFGIEKLEQTGKAYIVNGEKIKARKKTNNKWFEIQDSISYWEDFSKPKIVWGEISDKSKFAFDFLGEYIPEATTFYLNGEYIEYLLTALNSSVSEWLFSKTGTTTGVGTIRWKKYTIEQLIVAKPNYEQQKEHLAAFENLKAGKMSISDFKDFSNKLMYKIYELTNEEIRAIENLYN